MRRDFIPSRDADLVPWSKANSALLTAQPANYFVTPAIATAYAALVADYDAKFIAASSPDASRSARIAKDQARKALVGASPRGTAPDSAVTRRG
jgi:hypothetical protein